MTSAKRLNRLVVTGALCLCAAISHAQSINIRFGTTASRPSASYAAAGLPGYWNSFLVTPPSARQVLTSLQNTPINARLYQIGNSSMLAFDNPLTTGDDGLLMDHMILSMNNPVDGCFWVESLLPGQYEVTMYALTPNNPLLLNRVRVDDAVPGPMIIGGTWPGQHQDGVTYARFTVNTINNRIGLHDGLPSGFMQSGLNAIQLRFLGACPVPTITSQPSFAMICWGASGSVSVTATSATAATYRWQWSDIFTETWTDISNGANSLPDGNSFVAASAQTNTLSITPGTNQQWRIRVRAIVANACGINTSEPREVGSEPCCDFVDFNNDSSVFDPQDIDAFLSVYSEGPCIPGAATCNDIDFNNDGSLFDPCDIDSFLLQFSEGPCTPCGQ